MRKAALEIVDSILCAWCTNLFRRTRDQATRGVRHCSRRCAGFSRAVTIDDEHFRLMAARALAARTRNREARLAVLTAGLTSAEAYRKGYQSGYSAGKANRRALLHLTPRKRTAA